jgi:hypothetical protein
MNNIWVGDADGRVLGPVTLSVIQDLLSRGRLQGLTLASRDGRNWVGVNEMPELAVLVAARAKPMPLSDGSQEAARVEAEVARLRGRRPRDVIGVSASATGTEARETYFARVKPFHPSQLPAGASDRLKHAHAQMFQVLSFAMAELEREQTRLAPAATHTPTPSFTPEAFGGWRKMPDEKIRVELDVTEENSSIFTEVEAASIANGGFFLPCRKTLPLLQQVQVVLRFKTPAREVRGAGRIVCEVGSSRVKRERGVGVRFTSLTEEDKRFIQYFVRRSELERR